MKRQILLSGVFGPFGVDDAFGRKENIMELFHNQVTKAQGPASIRFHHRSFGLYFLAENVTAPVTVLDFPTRNQFIRQLESEPYDAVGISFIVPNFVKAREMARLVREIQPHAEIILGGHGAAIEDIETLIECDHVVRGEGIRWLRRYLGEEENRPIVHPILPAAEHKHVFGLPTPGVCGLLVPGVGCVNGCRFCATSHFFGRKYTSFFSEGEALYRQACRVADGLGTEELFVMDENFLKETDRARALLACMERDGRHFQFAIFSSAEAIEAFGVENMARLGVHFVWIGAESRRETYQKNHGRDLKSLVRQLRDHGVSVLVSGILLLEHHTPDNIWEDIDYIIGLDGDYTQFMMMTPLPGTGLYDDLKARNLIDFTLPYEEWHGQHLLNWHHPAFTRLQARDILEQAFEAEHDRLSASLYRMIVTALRGYRTLGRLAVNDPWMARRQAQRRTEVQELRQLIPTLRRFAPNDLARRRIETLRVECNREIGRPGARSLAMQTAARLISEGFGLRHRLGRDMDQPKFRISRYRWPQATPKLASVSPALGLRASSTR